MIEILASSGKPLWQKLTEKALTKAVETTVEEGVKAVVELWKTRHMKELDIEFEERKRARKAERADKGDEPAKNDEPAKKEKAPEKEKSSDDEKAPEKEGDDTP